MPAPGTQNIELNIEKTDPRESGFLDRFPAPICCPYEATGFA